MMSRMISALVTTTALLTTQVGLAVDEKTLSGTACTGEATETGDIDMFDRAVNNGAGTRDLWCPILRENTTNITGLDDLDVRVTDFSTGGTIDCTAYSMDLNGDVVDSSVQSTTSGGTQWLNFSSALGDSVGSGFYVLLCSLGNLDGVSHYIWDEP